MEAEFLGVLPSTNPLTKMTRVSFTLKLDYLN